METRTAVVPFEGAKLLTAEIDGEVYVSLPAVVDALGLDWSAQWRRVARHPIMKPAMRVMQHDQRTTGRQTVMLPIGMLSGFLFGINANRVRSELRDILIAFQRECFHALDAYWRSGVATNPRLRTIVETQSPNDGIDKSRGMRLAEERAEFEARTGIKLVEALRGLNVATKARLSSIEKGETPIRDRLLVALMRLGIDIHYVSYGERTLTSGERAIRDAYRDADERGRSMLIGIAEAVPARPLIH